MSVKEKFKKLGKKTRLFSAQIFALSGKMKFSEVETDKGALIYEGELTTGTEVFIAGEDEVPEVAPDDTYTTDTQRITVVDGVVTEIENLDGTEFEGEEPAEEIAEDVVEKLEEVLDLLEPLIEMSSQQQKKIERLEKIIKKTNEEFAALKAPRTTPVDKKPGERTGAAACKTYMDYARSKR